MGDAPVANHLPAKARRRDDPIKPQDPRLKEDTRCRFTEA
jgi:hypothetical protein